MGAAIPLLLSVAFVIRCAAQTPTGLHYEGPPGAHIYSAGYLMAWNSPENTQITIYNRDAKPAYSLPVLHVKDILYFVWAVDCDGIAARAYEIREAQNREGRIDLLDPSGKPTRTIKTGSYVAQHVTFAPDHTIWTVGYKLDYEHLGEDFNVVHHFARSGEELGQALPWSQIAGDYNAYTALQTVIGGRRLYVTSDRIGFEAGLYAGHNTWIEVSFAGDLLGKYDLGRFGDASYQPLAMTANGSVYAEIFREDHFDGWAVFDRSNGTWHNIAEYPKGRIIGSDGDNLVFSTRDGGSTVLQLVGSGSLRFKTPSQETAGN